MRQILTRIAVCVVAAASVASFADAAMAKAVTLQTQHIPPSRLKQSCDRGGGKYGTTTNGSYYCSKDGGGLVVCDAKTQKCDGYTPD